MTNAGYEIEKMVYTRQDEGVALGHDKKTEQWVTWMFEETKLKDGTKNYYYYWGHYADNETYAKIEYNERIANVLEERASRYREEAEWIRKPTF